MLKPVYSVNITNFCMKNEEPEKSGRSEVADKYISYIQLTDRETTLNPQSTIA